jgi:hypothetical protein
VFDLVAQLKFYFVFPRRERKETLKAKNATLELNESSIIDVSRQLALLRKDEFALRRENARRYRGCVVILVIRTFGQ